MKLLLTPDTVTPVSTISKLWANEVFECYVLEPPSPIPAGTYEVKLEHSERFGRLMPFLQNVPGHTGIEIHYGNTAADTRDCLLVGQTKAENWVGQSGLAFAPLFTKLEKEPTNSIEIRRQVVTVISPTPQPPVLVASVPQPQKGVAPMADPTVPSLPLQIHPKVAVYTIVLVLVNTLIATAKAHGWFDVSADAATLSTSLGALAAYYTSGA